LIKIVKTEAAAVIAEKTIIGVGGYPSANTGAPIVVTLAPALQIPKAVPAKIAGNIKEFARKHISKVPLTPPLPIAIK